MRSKKLQFGHTLLEHRFPPVSVFLFWQLVCRTSEKSEIESDNEIVPPEEFEESEAAWQDYLSGHDKGEPLSKVRRELLGHE